MMRSLALLGCLALAASAGKRPAAPKPGDHLRWMPTWNAAVEEARALNLPIVVHRHGFY
jgi:hypothetical protein